MQLLKNVIQKFQDDTIILMKKIPFIVMIIAITAIYLPILTGNLWLKWDMYHSYFPLDVSISDHIKEGALPLWEPFVRRGVPLGDLLGVPVWHPLTWILGIVGFSLEMMQFQYYIILLLSGVFMYLAVSNYVLNKWICMISGVAYATSGLFISNSSHLTFLIAAMSFPLLHYAVNKWFRTQRNIYTIITALALASFILNSYPTFFITSILFIIIESCFHYPSLKNKYKSNKKAITSVILFGLAASIIAISLSCITLYTSFQTISHITRSEIDWTFATNDSLSIWHWIGAISPVFVKMTAPFNTADVTMQNTYLAVPFLLSLFSRIPKRRLEWSFLILALLAFFLTLGRNGYLYYFVYKFIPGMDSFRFPAGLRYYVFFYVILLGSINIEHIRNEAKYHILKKRVSQFVIVLSVVLISFLCIQYSASDKMYSIYPPNTFWEIGLSIMLLLIFIKSMFYDKNRFGIISFIVISLAFSYLNFARNDSYVVGSEGRPPGYDNEISSMYSNSGYISNNYYIHPEPENPYQIGLGLFYKQFYTDGYIGGYELKKYYEAKEQGLLPKTGDPVVWVVNHDVAGEFTLDNQIIRVDRDTMVDSILTPSTLKIISNKIQADFNLPEKRFVVIEQNKYPGWKAYVNGNETELYEVSGGVLGIEVPSGKTNIHLEYDPKGVKIAFIISLISWIVVILMILYLLISRRKKIKGQI